MKKIMIAIIFLLLINMVSAIEAPALKATITSYEPQPASPGQYVTIYVKLENTGTENAENVILKAEPEFPFSIAPGQKTDEKIGILGAQRFHIAEFRVRVDENAVEGTNYFKISFNLDKEGKVISTQEIPISVQTLDAVLAITNITTIPEQIAPGQKGTIIIELENMADSRLTDISLGLDLSDDSTPFAPINSATEKSLYQLKPSEKKTFKFEVIAEPDATADVYKVPIDLSYYDNVGTSYTKDDLIGIIINNEPEIKIMVDSTDLLTDKKIGNVILKIVNKGLTDVKLMSLKLMESNQYDILSATNEEYIGNIDSDDFETVEFNLYLKDNKELNIPVEIKYRDNTNQEYTENFNLNLKIHSSEMLENGKNNTWMFFIAIIVIIAGVWYYKRKKKKQKK